MFLARKLANKRISQAFYVRMSLKPWTEKHSNSHALLKASHPTRVLPANHISVKAVSSLTALSICSSGVAAAAGHTTLVNDSVGSGFFGVCPRQGCASVADTFWPYIVPECRSNVCEGAGKLATDFREHQPTKCMQVRYMQSTVVMFTCHMLREVGS